MRVGWRRWLTERCRTRLDVMGVFGLGYVLGGHALGTWWGATVFLVSVMGVTDIAATLLRRLAPSGSAARVPAAE